MKTITLSSPKEDASAQIEFYIGATRCYLDALLKNNRAKNNDNAMLYDALGSLYKVRGINEETIKTIRKDAINIVTSLGLNCTKNNIPLSNSNVAYISPEGDESHLKQLCEVFNITWEDRETAFTWRKLADVSYEIYIKNIPQYMGEEYLY